MQQSAWLWILAVSLVACGGSRTQARAVQPSASVALPAIGVPAAAATPPPASEEFATLPVSARDPQWGAHDAPVTIVIFSDEMFKELIDAQLAEAEQARASGIAASDVYATLTNKHQALGAKPDPATLNEQAENAGVWKLPIEADDPVRGPNDALITIVEFADYQCPFSARVEATLKRVTERYGKDVRVVWKDNPLSFHPRARPAASLARFVYAHKGNLAFWNVHDRLFASRPRLEDEDLKPIAESAGVSWAAGKAALDAPQVRTKIDASKEEARKRAEEVLTQLKDGANFAQMAGQYSDEPGATTRGGALGKFQRVNMIAPFSDAAFALNVGELSGVVETPFGFHLILRTK